MSKYFIYLIVIAAIILSPKTVNAQIDQEYIINKYSEKVDKIIKAAMEDTIMFKRLEWLCDVYGPRFSGTENLEKAIAYLQDQVKGEGYDLVSEDEVMVPHWVRGEEHCNMTYPYNFKIDVMAFGGSVSCPEKGLKAKVLVVHSFDELKAKADQAKGKIVVYAGPWKGYGTTGQFRFVGGVEAAKVGAIASLSRSITPLEFHSLHTGMTWYADTITKIPHAAISPEDADLLFRLQEKGITPEIYLNVQNQSLPDVKSKNLYFEFQGSEKKDEYIATGGHIDSWDLGSGAHDDASGCLTSWGAVKILKDLGLRPKRTIRNVFWVNEENGVRGGKAYAEKHKNENHVLLFEFDSGLFTPDGLRFTVPDSIFKIVKYFEPLIKKLGDLKISDHGGGVDIGPMEKLGFPVASLGVKDNGDYFKYHHSDSDTFDKIKKEDFNKCMAAIAVGLYLYADLPVDYKKYILKK